LKISFPSAQDPTFSARHGDNITTCVVTIEADDDFALCFDTKPKIYSIFKDRAGDAGNRQRLLDRVQRDLVNIYPQLEGKRRISYSCVCLFSCSMECESDWCRVSSGKIEHAEVRGPYYRGLSHNPERYAAKGVRSDTPYPGLYMGGSDLTVGDSFSGSIVGGWLAANEVIGYSPIDLLYLRKNISSDLSQYIPTPIEVDDDLAVPYSPPTVPPESAEQETVEKE